MPPVYGYAQLEELDSELVAQEISNLDKQMARLRDTNEQLRQAASEERDRDSQDARQLLEIVDENELAIQAKGRRRDICLDVLRKRFGVADTAHYALDGASTIEGGQTPLDPPAQSTQPPIDANSGDAQQDNTETGVYL